MISISPFLLNRCCAAAWEQKMRDTVEFEDGVLPHKGAAASASVRNLIVKHFSRKITFNILVLFICFYDRNSG